MRQKLTACAVLCLLGCILQAPVKDRLDFSGSCHFLCTLFSLTFSLWPPCFTTCGVRESPPSNTLLCNPPQSSYLFFILPLVPPPFALTSEIAISEAVLSTFSHPLFFSPPFHLVSSLHQVSPMKHAKTPAPYSLLRVSISALMQGCLQALSQMKSMNMWRWSEPIKSQP